MELGPLQKKWMEALKAHPERQYKSALSNADGTKMCCLGQGLAILRDIPFGTCKIFDGEARYYMTNSYPELGLRDENGDLLTSHKGYHSLAAMNDSKQFSWPEIAAYIEANPGNVFTKSV